MRIVCIVDGSESRPANIFCIPRPSLEGDTGSRALVAALKEATVIDV